jgi:hypothetical protein
MNQPIYANLPARSTTTEIQQGLTGKALEVFNSAMTLEGKLEELKRKLVTAEPVIEPSVKAPDPNHILWACEGSRDALTRCHAVVDQLLRVV